VGDVEIVSLAPIRAGALVHPDHSEVAFLLPLTYARIDSSAIVANAQHEIAHVAQLHIHAGAAGVCESVPDSLVPDPVGLVTNDRMHRLALTLHDQV
jgi:hypothetical protein